MYIVFILPNRKNYGIGKVKKETEKTFSLDNTSEFDFMSIFSTVKKEHVVWKTMSVEAARQAKIIIMNAHRSRKSTIEVAEKGYISHITFGLYMLAGVISTQKSIEQNQVCGTCRHWQTCDSTEGWRINIPCTGLGGVHWEVKNE